MYIKATFDTDGATILWTLRKSVKSIDPLVGMLGFTDVKLGETPPFGYISKGNVLPLELDIADPLTAWLAGLATLFGAGNLV